MHILKDCWTLLLNILLSTSIQPTWYYPLGYCNKLSFYLPSMMPSPEAGKQAQIMIPPYLHCAWVLGWYFPVGKLYPFWPVHSAEYSFISPQNIFWVVLQIAWRLSSSLSAYDYNFFWERSDFLCGVLPQTPRFQWCLQGFSCSWNYKELSVVHLESSWLDACFYEEKSPNKTVSMCKYLSNTAEWWMLKHFEITLYPFSALWTSSSQSHLQIHLINWIPD